MFSFKRKNKRVYLDGASATPIRKEVLEEMFRASFLYGNPGSLHKEGMEAKELLEKNRKICSDFISARPKEIVFTSGATESLNLAIQGVVSKWKEENEGRPKILISAIDHAATIETGNLISDEVDVELIPVLENGLLDMKAFREMLDEKVILVSVIHGNNEIGTLMPIKEVSKTIRHFKKHTLNNYENKYPLLLVDASQSIKFEDINVLNFGADLVVVNSQKINGPKGASFLFIKDKTPIKQIMGGGHQEFGLRPGTENTMAISGFGKAIELLKQEREEVKEKIKNLQSYLIKELNNNFSGKFKINGDLENRLPDNLSITFPEFESEILVIELDELGFALSSKSACKSEKVGDSYVLKALDNSVDSNIGAIRITLHKNLNESDLNNFVSALKKIFSKYEGLPTKIV